MRPTTVSKNKDGGLGAENLELIDHMWKLASTWYLQGLYEDAERLDVQVAE